MIANKKGLSAIVTTLLVIVLVLVAVGIVWAVVRNVVQSGAGSTELAVKCLNTDVQATAIDCTTPSACVVTFTRTGSNDEDLGGVKLVFRDATGTAGTTSPVDVPTTTTNIKKLVGGSATVDSGLAAPVKVEVTAYFNDASGNEQLCTQTNSFTF